MPKNERTADGAATGCADGPAAGFVVGDCVTALAPVASASMSGQSCIGVVAFCNRVSAGRCGKVRRP